MPWIQLTLATTQADNDKAEQALLDAGALSVTLRDAEDNPVLEPAPGETPLWDKIILTGLFEADINTQQLRQQIHQSLGDEISLHIDALEDKDWVRAWMDNYKPMQFGQRLWVCPRHLQPPDPSAVNLMLDPGLAFGTGTHPTTALCLQWLDSINLKHLDILDYGCGSGILAIAALLLGASHCDGVDIDPQALLASMDNATANQVADQLSVFQPEQLTDKTYDVVMANILAGPLVELAPALAAYTKPGGRIVLSGILQTQADAIMNAYRQWFELEQPVFDEDWVRISGVKR
ncbi:MAG: 50S ribosomal protein L11 methyltransferase [Gammaproteobacteria bacterium]|nr:50S ribosomal protein L11 methyltransferase [Gammaproteobacteria bacterium]